jgi:hypothetical protein
VPLLSLLSLVSLSAAFAQIMAASAAAAGAEAEADAAAGDSEVLFTVTQPARVVRDERVSLLDQQVVAPSSIASAGTLARQLDSNTWHVQQHVAMEAFLYTSGPQEITRYNFGLVARVIKHELVRRQPHLSGGAYSAADTFQLTSVGEERRKSKPTLNCFRWEMACTGRAAHGKAAPNCQRVCGGISVCLESCTDGGKPHHACTVRIVVSASLEDVASNRMVATLKGASALPLLPMHPHRPSLSLAAHVLAGHHVPPGTPAVPPPLSGLTAAPSVKAKLKREVVGGQTPTVVVNNAATELELPEGSSSNSRFVPPAAVVARAAKSVRRAQRGGSMSDVTRVDLLVRCQLVQRQLVLLYIPGHILVLSTPWALERARTDGKLMVASDAKVDTVAGVVSKWSSIRTKTARGLSVPNAVWISPEENGTTVEEGATALAVNVACDKPDCDHAFIIEYRSDGSIHMRRRCKRWYAPAVCIDKHLPSFHGFQAAGYGWRSLCDFHGFKCQEEKLKGMSILGDDAILLTWAFRLIKRADSVDKAFELRDAYVLVVIAEAERAQPRWTLEDAEELVSYLDKCWMYPRYILESWIDAKGLTQAGYISVTSISESSHMYWSKFLMNSMANKIVSHTIVKTVGICADGSQTSGLFPDAERRWIGADGVAHKVAADVLIRRARAYLAFLEHGTTLADDTFDDTTFVKPFGNDNIRRHAVSSSERRTQKGIAPPFPPVLEPMRRILAHGGPRSFSRPDFYAVEVATGRCSCFDSTYHGRLSAVGPCKHALYCALVKEAEAPDEGKSFLRVRDRCVCEVKRYLHAREQSKPEESRCIPLYDATAEKTETTGEQLVALLRRHPSIPPSGTGEQPPAPVPSASDGEGEVDEDAERIEKEEAIRLGEATEELLITCTFPSLREGLGLIFAETTEESQGLVVVAYAPLRSGAFGPAPHDGETIAPGDVVLRANDESNLGKLLLADGQLDTCGSSRLELHFRRRSRGSAAELGGGSRRLTAKHNWAARKAGRHAAAPSRGGAAAPSAPRPSGGTAAASSSAPQPARERPRRTQAAAPTRAYAGEDESEEPTDDEYEPQPDAAVHLPSEVRELGSGSVLSGGSGRLGKKPVATRATQLKVPGKGRSTRGGERPASRDRRERACELRERLLASSQMSEEQRAERDLQLEGATYIA